jgi:hypothetical protein
MAELNYFFVCGAAKSGTTWLQRTLDAHPEVQCSGEGHFIERFSVPLAKVLREYAEQMTVVSRLVYEDAPVYPPIVQDDLDRVVRNFIIERLMKRQPKDGVRWIGDKTPRYTHCLPALLRIFPKARIINIVRDPRDVAMARMHHARRSGVPERVAEGTPERLNFIGDSGQAWRQSVAPVEAFARDHPGVVHTLRYEDMIAAPVEQAQALFRFLDVQHDTALMERVTAATSFEAMSGRKPGEEHPTSFLHKGVAGDWIGRLEPEALALLQESCGELMRAKGYA